MNGRARALGLTGLVLVVLVALTGWAQDTVVPLGIIPSPPASSELVVRIWVDKPA